MGNTSIAWTEKVWNPVTGCTKISPGCAHCYAERMAHRLAGRCGYPPSPDQFRVTLHPDKLDEPLHWKKPAMIFVDSMGDLFHKDVPLSFQTDVFEVMTKAYWHTFQILTKRADLMRSRWCVIGAGVAYRLGKQKEPNFWPPKNIWLGVSAENQQCADERIPLLLQTPAVGRFVSVEPMLGPVNVQGYLLDGWHKYDPKIRWLIIGSESVSGDPGRSCNLAWVRSLRDQCVNAGTALFIKQLEIGGKLVKMPELDGRQWAEMPGEAA